MLHKIHKKNIFSAREKVTGDMWFQVDFFSGEMVLRGVVCVPNDYAQTEHIMTFFIYR
jgi:hypothetical protein